MGRGRWGVDLVGWSTGAALGDVDEDGDLDLYVAQYVNFDRQDVPPRSGMWKGVLVFAGPVGMQGASDVLYRNEGDGSFADATEETGVAVDTPWYGLGVVIGDFDGDGDRDIFVANDSAPNFLFRNGGGGMFEEVALEAQAAFSAEGKAQAGMGVAYGDYDADGLGDLLLTHFEDDYNTLYRNLGDGSFGVTSFEQGLGAPSQPRLGFGTCFLDYDNDGDQDLAVANGHVYPQIKYARDGGYAEPNQLFVNQGRAGQWRFVEHAGGDLDRANVSRGMCKGDYDNDGDVDLLITNLDSGPALLRNERGNANNWLALRLVGRQGNSQGIGARVRVVAGDLDQMVEIVSGGSFLSHSDTRAHFGLGSHQRAERVEVRWPGGQVQVLRDVAVNQLLVVKEAVP